MGRKKHYLAPDTVEIEDDEFNPDFMPSAPMSTGTIPRHSSHYSSKCQPAGVNQHSSHTFKSEKERLEKRGKKTTPAATRVRKIRREEKERKSSCFLVIELPPVQAGGTWSKELAGLQASESPRFTQLNRALSLKVGLDGDQVVRATSVGHEELQEGSRSVRVRVGKRTGCRPAS